MAETRVHNQGRGGRGPGVPDSAAEKPAWHRLAATEVLKRLEADPLRGLTGDEARRRLADHGPNQLPEKSGTPLWAVFAGQFRDFMVLVLLVATAVSFILGEVVDAIAIAVIVLLNAALGSLQEFRAERSLAALKRLTAPRARVWREGRPLEIPSAEVVPGDILLLAAGDRVAADGRLIEAVALEADESALTGESLPVAKHTEVLPENGTSALGDRRNMIWQGTVVTQGHGRAVVVATGQKTEMGGVAGLIQAAGEEATPLQRRLDQLGRTLVLLCLGVSAAVALGGLGRGEDPYQMLLAGVSLAVAAIPEGLPAVVTIVLALGVQRMLRRRAIIRRLPAVETLGCVTVICSDKTGTLTRNEMTVRALYTGGRLYAVTGEGYRPEGGITLAGRPAALSPTVVDNGSFPADPLAQVVLTATLCNNASLERRGPGSRGGLAKAKGAFLGNAGEWRVEGDPTEGALLVLAAKAGCDRDRMNARFPRIGEIPFTSERKMMTVICHASPGPRAPHPDARGASPRGLTKGAPEAVLALCRDLAENGRARPLTEEDRRRILAVSEELAGQAYRVLALAGRDLSDGEGVERDLTFVGLVGMIDAPRPEVRESVRRCRQAGIRTVMITGDHALTAGAVAAELGLLEPPGRVVTGEELDRLSDEALARAAAETSVYARVSPAHKLRIVRALKAAGHRVAMTGDGVNDAPALKAADIGVAMGQGGTQVAKEAADMVLVDDHFATIVAAVEEGRAIYDNIRKFIRYLLACNTGEVLVMFLATLLGLPLPLLPIQILLVNLVTDGLPAIALGVDPPEPGLMSRPPRAPDESVFARGLWRKILARGATIGLATLTAFVASGLLTGDLDRARTVATTVLALSQLIFVFECRSESRDLLAVGVTGNPALLWAVGASFACLLAVLYVPALQVAFHTVPLSAGEWAGALAAALAGTLLAALPRTVGRRLAGVVVRT